MEKFYSFTQKDMNYELAKELKDAGFPQYVDESPNGRRYYFINEDNLSFIHKGGPGTSSIDNAHDGSDIMLAPTLEELIEACPQFTRLFVTQNETDCWRAESDHPECIGDAFTPQEAVARLWLALNTNQPTT